MVRRKGKDRRPGTQIRDNRVHEIYSQVVSELGELRHAVSKGYIYNLIQKQTSLCTKTIAYILNHTTFRKL